MRRTGAHRTGGGSADLSGLASGVLKASSDTSDPRWVLTSADALGAHPCYREQPLETQIRIGIWRWAVIAKVGMQFENILMRGAPSTTSTNSATAKRSATTSPTRSPRRPTTPRCSRPSSSMRATAASTSSS
ncbi:diiron oxygenase [Streptomyces sp. NPDC101117]|uniref:diiron oxygenase n=1 Tax=Streptomyces sp. NPDC101117 TaxID=3366108 RepID=UPI003818418C